MTVQSDQDFPGGFVDADDSPRAGLIRAIKLAGAGLLALFMAGATAGAFAAMAEDDHYTARGIAVVAAFALGAVASSVWIVRLLRSRAATPFQPAKVARANRMLVASGAIGGVLGVLITVGGISDPTYAISDAPIAPVLALIALALVGLAVPVVTLVWHRSVDEHEERIYRFASLIAIYAYFWISMVWWIAARGGFLPPADGKIIFGLVWAIWGLSWLWGKYR